MGSVKVSWGWGMESCGGGGSIWIWTVRVDSCLGRSIIPSFISISTYHSQILCVIPVPIVRWTLVGIAFLVSGYFLVANIYPILASVCKLINKCIFRCNSRQIQAEQKAARLLVIILVILHAALALTFKLLFFSYYVVHEIGVPDPLGGEGPGTVTGAVTNSTVAMM